MKKYIILLMMASAGTMAAQELGQEEAQLDRTVVVENLYNPDIMNANKMNFLPELEEPQVVKKQIEYATKANPSRTFVFDPMGSFGTTPERGAAYKGYLRAGYGMNGNADGRLSYRLDLGSRDELNAQVAFRGMDGSVPLPGIPTSEYEWDARTYRTHGALDWTHRFKTLTLGVEADGENQVFNYNNINLYENNHQHNLMGSFRVGLDNQRSSTSPVHFDAGTGLLYAQQKYAFGYHQDSEAYREMIVRTHAHVSGKINAQHSIHIAGQMDNVFVIPGGPYKRVTHTVLQLNPYWMAAGNRWNAKLGMHVDPLFGNGKTSISLAPDIYGEYRLGKACLLYLQARGGRTVNDFRTVNAFAPYAEYPLFTDGAEGIGYYTPRHTYTSVDGRAGFRATPVTELSIHLYGGYRSMDDCLFSTYLLGRRGEHFNYLLQGDANILYAGVHVGYAWKDIFTTQAAFEWNNWDSGLLKEFSTLSPEATFRWDINVRPVARLNIGLSYQYEQRCENNVGERADAINNLGATASYRILDWLSIYAQGDNLLNQKYYLNILHPAQGINFLGGAVLEF